MQEMHSKVALIKSIASDVVQQLQEVCITNPDFVAQVATVCVYNRPAICPRQLGNI
jgi:hypothetical protein